MLSAWRIPVPIAATGTKELWYHGNLLASSVFLTDRAGQVKTHTIYDEWGQPERDTRYDSTQ